MTLTNLLEPGAVSHRRRVRTKGGETEMALSPEDQCALSTAISLKRIADSLEKLTTTDQTFTIEQLAWHAGRSFEQGRRTDR